MNKKVVLKWTDGSYLQFGGVNHTGIPYGTASIVDAHVYTLPEDQKLIDGMLSFYKGLSVEQQGVLYE